MGGWTLYEGDCLEVMREMEAGSVDAVITDPPFSFAGGISNGRSSVTDAQFFEHWLSDVFRQLYRVATAESVWFVWGDWRTIPVYDNALKKAAPDYHAARWVSQVLIHDREMVGMGSPFRNQTDWIAVIRGKKTDFRGRIPNTQPNIVREYWYYGKHPHHPAEKSESFASKLVKWCSDEGQTVLDPFAGSGPVLLAAVKSGRNAIGIEREPEYCEIIRRRMAGVQPPLPLVAGT